MDVLSSLYEAQKPYMTTYILVGGGVVATLFVAHKFVFGLRKRGPGNIQAPPNTAIIYQMLRGPFAPSLSPFPVKLETYCRLAKIPYLPDCTGRFSSRDKIPWMTYNGEVVEDSQHCINFLNKKVGVDLNSHLDTEQRAVAKMIQVLVDEHLYWSLALFRWVFHDKEFYAVAKKIVGIPGFLITMTKRLILNEAKGQGIGRHSASEVKQIMMDDLKCLSDFLGNKRFMLGDRMCEADCSVFGILSQLAFNHFENSVMKGVLEDNFPNLHQYVLRVKNEFWPDWDECIKPASVKK